MYGVSVPVDLCAIIRGSGENHLEMFDSFVGAGEPEHTLHIQGVGLQVGAARDDH